MYLPRDYRHAPPYPISLTLLLDTKLDPTTILSQYHHPKPQEARSWKLEEALLADQQVRAEYSGMGPHSPALRGHLTLYVGLLPRECQFHHSLVSDASLGRQRQGRTEELCHLKKQKSGHRLISNDGSFFTLKTRTRGVLLEELLLGVNLQKWEFHGSRLVAFSDPHSPLPLKTRTL